MQFDNDQQFFFLLLLFFCVLCFVMSSPTSTHIASYRELVLRTIATNSLSCVDNESLISLRSFEHSSKWIMELESDSNGWVYRERGLHEALFGTKDAAYEWFIWSMECGNVFAMTDFALFHWPTGLFQGDYSVFKFWTEKAVRLNCPRALNSLGSHLGKSKLGIRYLARASALGNPFGKINLQNMLRNMSDRNSVNVLFVEVAESCEAEIQRLRAIQSFGVDCIKNLIMEYDVE